MALFVLGDTHLSFGVPEKPMDIFQGWENYQVLLEKNWNGDNCTRRHNCTCWGHFMGHESGAGKGRFRLPAPSHGDENYLERAIMIIGGIP